MVISTQKNSLPYKHEVIILIKMQVKYLKSNILYTYNREPEAEKTAAGLLAYSLWQRHSMKSGLQSGLQSTTAERLKRLK